MGCAFPLAKSKLPTATALLALASTSIAARANITFGTFSNTQANQLHYTNATGTLAVTNAAANFTSFGPPNQLLNYSGPITYSVSATPADPAINLAGTISPVLNGEIILKKGATTVLDILFTGAVLSAQAGSNSGVFLADGTLPGESVTFTSDPSIQIASLAGQGSFAMNLTTLPAITISGTNFASFTATGGVILSLQPAPEPAALALLSAAAPLLLRRRAKNARA